MTEKEARLKAWCRERGVDGVWLRRRTNIAWLTDGADVHVDSSSTTGAASLVWTSRKKTVLTNTIEAARLAAEEFGQGWAFEVSNWWEKAPAPKGRLASDFPDDPFADLRAPLTEIEVGRVRALGRETANGLEASMKALRSGMSEHEAAADLAGRLRRGGILAPVLLVAADDRIAKFRHPIPTSRRIRKTAMVAVTSRRHGLMVAMTRLIHFGKRLPPDLRRRHEAVCRVDEAFHAATAPGQRWCDVLEVGIQVYRETGFGDEWKRHHQGGPVGYEGREFKATPTETRTLVEPQAVAWNPSIAGTKSEDTLLSTGELLTGMRDWPLEGARPAILLR